VILLTATSSVEAPRAAAPVINAIIGDAATLVAKGVRELIEPLLMFFDRKL
jgi:hypothetical protein